MVQARATTKAALEKIAGVGDARIEKYGARVLELPRPAVVIEEASDARAGHLFERIVDRDNLRLAVHKALRGKRSKADVRAFVARPRTRTSSACGSSCPRGDVPLGGITSSRSSTRRSGSSRRLFSRTRAASRDHERLRAGLRALADRRHLRLPPREGPARRARPSQALRRPVSRSSSSSTSANTSTASRTRLLLARLERLFKDRRLLDLFEPDRRVVPRRRRARPADRQPDLAALRQLLPGLVRPFREGAPARARATCATWTTWRCGRDTPASSASTWRPATAFLQDELGLDAQADARTSTAPRTGWTSWAAGFSAAHDRSIAAAASGSGASCAPGGALSRRRDRRGGTCSSGPRP